MNHMDGFSVTDNPADASIWKFGNIRQVRPPSKLCRVWLPDGFLPNISTKAPILGPNPAPRTAAYLKMKG